MLAGWQNGSCSGLQIPLSRFDSGSGLHSSYKTNLTFMISDAPKAHELILLGGGHSHLSVLKYFAMHPIAGLSITFEPVGPGMEPLINNKLFSKSI